MLIIALVVGAALLAWVWNRSSGLGAIFAVAVFGVGALYFTGRLDPVLYKVGLNYETCGTNGFGATFCGEELTQYQDNLRRVQEEAAAEAAKAKRELAREQAKAEADAAAAQADLQRQIDAADQQAQAEMCNIGPAIAGC